jgi:SAM-dependent methyltransferase
MESVANNFMRFFRNSSPGQAQSVKPPQPKQRLTRRSSGLGEVARVLKSEEPICVLDIGATSATNIRYFTELGHRIYSEDLLDASSDPSLATKDEQGQTILDSKRFLAENLVLPNGRFDVVLCWNLADYMEESLVKPVVARLWSVMKPGGVLLAFFHMKEAGPDAPCYRYNIVGPDTLEMQNLETRDLRKNLGGAGHAAIGSNFKLQRVFNNRHIETLFRDFASIKFFLTRDNIREVLVVR